MPQHTPEHQNPLGAAVAGQQPFGQAPVVNPAAPLNPQQQGLFDQALATLSRPDVKAGLLQASVSLLTGRRSGSAGESIGRFIGGVGQGIGAQQDRTEAQRQQGVKEAQENRRVGVAERQVGAQERQAGADERRAGVSEGQLDLDRETRPRELDIRADVNTIARERIRADRDLTHAQIARDLQISGDDRRSRLLNGLLDIQAKQIEAGAFNPDGPQTTFNPGAIIGMMRVFEAALTPEGNIRLPDGSVDAILSQPNGPENMSLLQRQGLLNVSPDADARITAAIQTKLNARASTTSAEDTRAAEKSSFEERRRLRGIIGRVPIGTDDSDLARAEHALPATAGTLFALPPEDFQGIMRLIKGNRALDAVARARYGDDVVEQLYAQFDLGRNLRNEEPARGESPDRAKARDILKRNQ